MTMARNRTIPSTERFGSPRSKARAPLAAAALLIGAWLWLYRPVLSWLTMIYPRDDFRVNLIALVAAALLVAARARAGAWPGFSARPAWRPLPLALAAVGSVAYLLVERFLDVNILSAALFGLSTYGLLGLWLPPRAWWAGWPAVLLIVGTLPFGAHLQVFVGLPVRVATADLVAHALGAAGIAATSRDAILTLERSVARVDLPCSGVQGLWTGGLFFLAATWLDGRRIGVRWLGAAIVTGALLLVGNAGRVLALVVIGDVLDAPAFARLAHVPLGVLAFAAACATGAWLLRWVPRAGGAPDGDHGRVPTTPAAPRILALAGAVCVLALAYQPRPASALAPPLPEALWPTRLATTADPLTPEEQAWLARDGAERAERVRFAWPAPDGAITGSATVIASATWRAQHLPERCLEVYGLRLASVRSMAIAADFPLRVVALGDPGLGQPTRSAVYWFQSATRLTDDYAVRIAADLAPRPERWVLVALLFDGATDPASAPVAELAQALRVAIAASLKQPTSGGSS